MPADSGYRLTEVARVQVDAQLAREQLGEEIARREEALETWGAEKRAALRLRLLRSA